MDTGFFLVLSPSKLPNTGELRRLTYLSLSLGHNTKALALHFIQRPNEMRRNKLRFDRACRAPILPDS